MQSSVIDFEKLKNALQVLNESWSSEEVHPIPTHTIEEYSGIPDAFIRFQRMVVDALELYDNAKRMASVSNLGLSESIYRKAEPFQKGNFTMAVVGKMSSGKSTFINALLRDKNLLPTGHLQTTCTITTIRHSENKCLTVRYGDGTVESYTDDIPGHLSSLVAVEDKYQDLPVNSINQLILADKTEDEICSERILQELVEASDVSDARIDVHLLREYIREHKKASLPIRVDIDCPLPLEYQGWHIVDTPGVDAIGGIEDETVEFLGGTDVFGNHNVDAIVFIQSVKSNIEERTLNKFVATTLDSLTEEARKRCFFILNKISEKDFQMNKDAVLSRLDSLYVKTGKLPEGRVLYVDSLYSLLAEDDTLDYKSLIRRSSPTPAGWKPDVWELCREEIKQVGTDLEYDDEKEFNNENVRNKLYEVSRFNYLRNVLARFVAEEKAGAFDSIIEMIIREITQCIDIKTKDLEVLRVGLGQSPEEFREALKNEKSKLDDFQLKANGKVQEIYNRFSKEKVYQIFEEERNRQASDFSSLPSWEEMRERADKVGKRIEEVASGLKRSITDSVKDYIDENCVSFNIKLPAIDYDEIEKKALEITATYEDQTVKVGKKKGFFNGIKRGFGSLFKKNWGWDTSIIQVRVEHKDEADKKAIKDVEESFKYNVKKFVEDTQNQIESITRLLDERIKSAITDRKETLSSLEKKEEIADNMRRIDAERFVLDAHRKAMEIYTKL